MSDCEFPGCARPEQRAGLCGYHDQQRRRGEPLHPLGITLRNGRWAVAVSLHGHNHRGGYYDDLAEAVVELEKLKLRLGVA